MSHGGDHDTCKFGHVLLTNTHEDLGKVEGGSIDSELHKKIVSGEISSLDELEGGLGTITGEPYKHVKVQANSQGMPRAAALDGADKWDEDVGYDVAKTEEKIYVAPQSNLHSEYMQRKQQAEQNIKNTMQNISTLIKQKHMLEHDIRKLRTRAENMRSGDEDIIKGDFIELVDGAGAAGGQGGDEASLKFYRDNNIYPSIVADFQEMESMDDLKPEDDGGTGKLADLPENEKAILRKKWAMYEKWKDLYGSEVQRKLKELKQQLRSVESSIEETKNWLEPYVRDAVMINEGTVEDLQQEMGIHISWKGASTLFRQMEFIAYKPMENEHGTLKVIEDEDDATHYRIIYITVVHGNLAGWEQPQSPAQGPSMARIMWHPVIACKHVFDNFFKEKIKKQQKQFEQILKDYKGESLETEQGRKLSKARQNEDMSVADLRHEVAEEADSSIPVQFSSTIRRIEDGIDNPEKLNEKYGEDGENIVEIVEEILDITLVEDEGDEDEDMYEGLEKSIRELTGQVDHFKIPSTESPMDDLREEMKFNFYYDYKIGLGLYTMN